MQYRGKREVWGRQLRQWWQECGDKWVYTTGKKKRNRTTNRRWGKMISIYLSHTSSSDTIIFFLLSFIFVSISCSTAVHSRPSCYFSLPCFMSQCVSHTLYVTVCFTVHWELLAICSPSVFQVCDSARLSFLPVTRGYLFFSHIFLSPLPTFSSLTVQQYHGKEEQKEAATITEG